MPDSTQDAIARIIDPDAFHDGLPTDGCGAYWMGRRNKAKSKASEILTLPAAALATKDAEIAALKAAKAWYETDAQRDLNRILPDMESKIAHAKTHYGHCIPDHLFSPLEASITELRVLRHELAAIEAKP